MQKEELKMLRQFAQTVFDLSHGLDSDDSPKAKADLIRTIGSLAYSAVEISGLYQRKGADND